MSQGLRLPDWANALLPLMQLMLQAAWESLTVNREGEGTGLVHIRGLHGVLSPANADGRCCSATLREGQKVW